MSAWWLGVSGAQAAITCGGHQHRLRWEHGRLQALDHGDPGSERALAALGGEPFACIEALDSWERHRDDLRLLTLGSRGPIDRLVADPEARQAGGFTRAVRVSIAAPRQGFGRRPMAPGQAGQRAGRMSHADRDQAELMQLLRLDGGLPDRLQAMVAATWERRIRTGHRQLIRAQPQLQAALHGRTLAALAAWQSLDGLDALITMRPPAAPRSLVRHDGRIHAELPFAWLVDVWARGLTTVFGRFCLTARSSTGRRWTLTTVGADLGTPETIVVTLPDS